MKRRIKRKYFGIMIICIAIIITAVFALIGFRFIQNLAYEFIISWQKIMEFIIVTLILLIDIGVVLIICDYDKKFLKPDRKKILILFIIAILGFLSFIMSIGFGRPAGLSILILNIIFNLFTILAVYIFPQILPSLIYNDIFIITINIFYWYLLSCLLVWVYNKFRKRK